MNLDQKKFVLISLALTAFAQPALADGCRSSLFSPAGQQRFLEFEITCAAIYLLVLLAKTAFLTWFAHRSTFLQISLRSIVGTVLSFALGSAVCFFTLKNSASSLNNAFLLFGSLVLFLSLTSTLSDSIFALNWQKLGLGQVALSLTLNLLVNCLSLVAIYLSLFASLKSFFYERSFGKLIY